MEKVKAEQATPEVFENDIALYLSEFCETQHIEDIKKESQSVWNGALMYIRRRVFPAPSVLKMTKPLDGYANNNNNLNKSNCNSYNIDLVNSVCDYYIYMCMLYDKEVSLVGFSNLTGINTDTLIDWGNNINKLSKSSCEIYKKLNKYREESLSNKLVTGKQNPVGILGVLNRHYAWNMPGVRNDADKRHALTAGELPQLSGNAAQITQKNTQPQDIVPPQDDNTT